MGWFPPSLLPCPPLAMLPACLGMLLPGAAGAELAPAEKEKAALAVEGNITVKWHTEGNITMKWHIEGNITVKWHIEGNITMKWHICLRGQGALCPQSPGGSLGSPPGTSLFTRSQSIPMGAVPAPLLFQGSVKRAAG